MFPKDSQNQVNMLPSLQKEVTWSRIASWIPLYSFIDESLVALFKVTPEKKAQLVGEG